MMRRAAPRSSPLPAESYGAGMQQIPKVGDRVRVTGAMNDPDPVAVGEVGTVDWVGSWSSPLTRQVGVKWDNGRTLGLIDGDPFAIL